MNCEQCGTITEYGNCPTCHPHRVEANRRFRICQTNECGNYGPKENGCTGCNLTATKCDLFKRHLRLEKIEGCLMFDHSAQ